MSNSASRGETESLQFVRFRLTLLTFCNCRSHVVSRWPGALFVHLRASGLRQVHGFAACWFFHEFECSNADPNLLYPQTP